MIWIFSFREIAAASPCGTWILSVHQTRLLGRRFYAFPGRLGTVSFLWTVNGSFAVFCHSPNTHSNLRTLSQIIPDTGNGACAQSYNGARVTDDTFLECRHNRAKLSILFLKIDILFCGIQLGSGRLFHYRSVTQNAKPTFLRTPSMIEAYASRCPCGILLQVSAFR